MEPGPTNDPIFLKADLSDSELGSQELVRALSDSEEEDLQVSASHLQELVRAKFPALWNLAQDIKLHLQRKVPVIVVEKLQFAQFGLRRSKLLFLAFASCIGPPTRVDPYSRTRIWEVSPRVEPDPTYIPTITEHNYGADLHTDSSFKETPEQYVLFFTFRPAGDGGGVSQLLSAEHLLKTLSDSDDGKECIRLLKTITWPFRVPTVFTKQQSETELEWITAPILSDHPRIRFRYDLITSALDHLPITLSSEAEWALSYLNKTLHESDPFSLTLNQGDLLVLDNHAVLHGRTPFEDLNRVLLRVRLSTSH